MTKWRYFRCTNPECGKYFQVRPGIGQRDLKCVCGESNLESVKKRQYEQGAKRGLC